MVSYAVVIDVGDRSVIAMITDDIYKAVDERHRISGALTEFCKMVDMPMKENGARELEQKMANYGVKLLVDEVKKALVRIDECKSEG